MNLHCDECDSDCCNGLSSHSCYEHCEEIHIDAGENETSLLLFEALLDMGMSKAELNRIAASSDVATSFRKYLVDSL